MNINYTHQTESVGLYGCGISCGAIEAVHPTGPIRKNRVME